MKHFLIRLFNMVFGLIVFSFGIILTLKANIGYAPWEVFHVGLAKTTGVSLGLVTIIVGLFIIILVTVLGETLGIGTIASIIVTGVFIDVFLILDLIPDANNLIIGIGMLIIGLFILAIGTYFYIKSAFGVGPRDNLMVVLARRTRLPVGACRFIVELSVTLVGWLLGGMLGIGTVISVFAVGFCVQLVFGLFKLDVTSVKHESIKDTFAAVKDMIQ